MAPFCHPPEPSSPDSAAVRCTLIELLWLAAQDSEERHIGAILLWTIINSIFGTFIYTFLLNKSEMSYTEFSYASSYSEGFTLTKSFTMNMQPFDHIAFAFLCEVRFYVLLIHTVYYMYHVGLCQSTFKTLGTKCCVVNRIHMYKAVDNNRLVTFKIQN